MKHCHLMESTNISTLAKIQKFLFLFQQLLQLNWTNRKMNHRCCNVQVKMLPDEKT